MNYALFANPREGSPILTKLYQIKPPSVVFTFFNNIDSWKRILYRALRGSLTVEDKLRFFYKTEFYDYRMLTPALLEKIIIKNRIEIGIITTFYSLLKKEIYDCFPLGVFNFHPSLLPLHGGANPFFWVIYNGDQYSGTTCYKINEILDSGEAFIQNRYNVEGMNSRQLFKLFADDIKEMVPMLLADYHKLQINSFPTGATVYDPKNLPEISEIKDEVTLERYHRAYKLYSK